MTNPGWLQNQQAFQNQLQHVQLNQLNQLGVSNYGLGQTYSPIHGGSFVQSCFSDQGAFAELTARATERAEQALRDIPNEGVRAGEVTAWRAWYLGYDSSLGVRLRSISILKSWSPDEPMDGDPNKVGHVDAIRGNWLGQGVYAVKGQHMARGLASPYPNYGVYGEVDLWGEIHEHELGYRAEHAKIKSLVLVVDRRLVPKPEAPRRSWWDRIIGKPEQPPKSDPAEQVRVSLADAYKVDCVIEDV